VSPIRPRHWAAPTALALVVVCGCTSQTAGPTAADGQSPPPRPHASEKVGHPPEGLQSARAPTTRPSSPARAVSRVKPGVPVALRIGGESWPVEPVGGDAAQALTIPGSINTLGWWRAGAKAGSPSGFTVLAGHATQDGGGAANRWWSLEPGDRVAVRTAHSTLAYRVTSRTTYAYADMPYARWFPAAGPSGPPALALITCADYHDGQWHANTVVEAVPLGT
jgi:hypothetical protein